MNRVSRLFKDLKKDGKKALIPYLSAGFPALSDTLPLLRVVADSGADCIELGVPFSDPVADGPVIQEASQKALRAGATLSWILSTVKEFKSSVAKSSSAITESNFIIGESNRLDTSSSSPPILLMSYCNPILSYGIEKFCRDAEASGVDGLIVADLPWEESGLLFPLLQKHRLAHVPFVSPTTSEARMKKIEAVSSGFTYCLSVKGVTGERGSFPDGTKDFLRRARRCIKAPLCLGFGISSPHQVEEVIDLVDGIILGSVLIPAIKKGPDRLRMLLSGFREVLEFSRAGLSSQGT